MLRPTLLFLVLAGLAAMPARAQEVTGLDDWNVFLDPGHYQNVNVGAYGYSEARKVLRVGFELRDLLTETTDIDTVYMSRTDDIREVSLSQRVDHANSVGAAYFHSIHSNAASNADANVEFVLWPQYRDYSEARPHGGRKMANVMAELLGRAMRIPSRGGIGECAFYGVSNCSTSSPKGSRNFVQRYTTMASSLSEAGFHTNPTQNLRNMNADWKRLEARAMYWSILAFHGLARPPAHIATGIVTDFETGLPLNGATVTVADTAYTTDTWESLFRQYTGPRSAMRNGFYYLDALPGGTLPVTATAEGYETFTGEVALIDTFFTFNDIGLVSTVPPTVAEATPAPGTDHFRITDPLILVFSRYMDRASVEAAFSIEPHLDGKFVWSADDRVFFTPNDGFAPRTQYTVTLGEGARGKFGHDFDGDGDGAAGGTYSFSFTTGFPDTQPPYITGSSPRVNARGVDLQPILTLTYSEPIDPASLVGRVHLERTGGARVAGDLRYYEVGEGSLISFFPAQPLAPATVYTLVVAPGISDRYFNAETVEKQLRFTTGDDPDVTITSIDDFESDAVATWWGPLRSGSTIGVVPDSTTLSADSTVVNLTTGSRAALRLDYGWEASSSEWLIRTYVPPGSPAGGVRFDDTYALQLYVFGDGSGTQLRFAVDDNVPAGGSADHEVSPWFEVDWLGWRPVTWDLSADGTGTWLGDGTLDGTLRFDSIQLTHTAGDPAFGTLYFDDLRLLKPRSATPTEPTPDLPARVALHAAYPNPFNPETTLSFDLSAPTRVTLAVYNALGAEVARLADAAPYHAGTHALTWEAGNLPTGVYFVRLQAAGQTRTTQVVLMK